MGAMMRIKSIVSGLVLAGAFLSGSAQAAIVSASYNGFDVYWDDAQLGGIVSQYTTDKAFGASSQITNSFALLGWRPIWSVTSSNGVGLIETVNTIAVSIVAKDGWGLLNTSITEWGNYFLQASDNTTQARIIVTTSYQANGGVASYEYSRPYSSAIYGGLTGQWSAQVGAAFGQPDGDNFAKQIDLSFTNFIDVNAAGATSDISTVRLADYDDSWSPDRRAFSSSITAIKINAVPEPASIALLGLGLAGIGFSCRKKQ